MGECISTALAEYNGKGETRDEALKDLIRNVGTNYNNVQIHQKYCIVFTHNNVQFKNEIDIKQTNDVWHAQTNLYLTTISSEGKTKSESIINLLNKIKTECPDAFYVPLYLLSYNGSRTGKSHTISIVMHKSGDIWNASIY